MTRIVGTPRNIGIVAAPAPAWFENLADLTWTPIAGGSSYAGSTFQKGATLADNTPSPLPPGGDGIQGIIKAWNGACSIQSTGQAVHLIVCEGGHNAYYGNEIYALDLMVEQPGWSRIWGPTPNAQLNTSNISYNEAHVSNLDGSPRTAHGWNSRIGTKNGRLFITETSASPTGEWTTDLWSIDYNDLNGDADASKWMYHGRLWTTIPGGSPGSTFGFQAAPMCYDPIADKIFYNAEYIAASPSDSLRVVDCPAIVASGAQSTAGNQTPNTDLVNPNVINANDFSNAWSFIATAASPRAMVIGAFDTGNLYVMNAESPGTFVTKSITLNAVRGGGGYNPTYNAVVVAGWGEGAVDTNIYVLSLPADPVSAAAGSFSWATHACAGSIPKLTLSGGVYSKMQYYPNMGNGDGLMVVHVDDVDQPTMVCKVPASIF